MMRRGFTLLEVMVAVAILGLGLTAILSAQAGAVSGASHARHMSIAVGLARCKMTEIEEQLYREGFQELDQTDSGPCCEGDETPNISCTWTVTKPVMPEPEYGDLDLDTDLDTDSLGALGLLDRQQQGESLFDSNATVHDVAETLGGENEMASMASAGMGGIAAMVMSMVYPDLQALFEASTRRVTVLLTWTEGEREYDIELVQWITDPRQAGLVAGTDDALMNSSDASGNPLGSGLAPTQKPSTFRGAR